MTCKPVVIFTDGTCEDDGELVTCGAELCSTILPTGSRGICEVLPKEVVNSRRRDGKKQFGWTGRNATGVGEQTSVEKLNLSEKSSLVHGQRFRRSSLWVVRVEFSVLCVLLKN